MSKQLKNTVQAYIQKHQLFGAQTPLLIASSGGPDSMAATVILQQLGFPIGLAHCNFKLRGAAANQDQDFVEAYAKQHGIPFFTMSFNTEIFAFRNKISVQEAARILRYQFFEEVRKANGYHFIVTAHHQDDQVETVLLNLLNGSGIKGVRGMLPKNGKIVRPLLNITKDEILGFLKEENVEFRTDASNEENKYTRNKLRNELIPQLASINKQASQHIADFATRNLEVEALLEERLAQIKKRILVQRLDTIEVKLGLIKTHAAGNTILFSVLKDFGFNANQSQEIFENLAEQSGAEYVSATHRLIRDRNSLFISPLQSEQVYIKQFDKIPNQIYFEAGEQVVKIQVDVLPISKCSLKKSANYAFLDADKIEMPLTIRFWKAGDYFYPYGLTKPKSDKVGKKKLSKYFKDEKMNVFEKQHTPVLFSGEHLIWLVGHRIDDRFKVTEETKRVLKLKLIKGV